MNKSDVVRAAIPDADEDLVSHIVWGRTAFPFVKLTARSLYAAASRFRRANDSGKTLCDMCDRLAIDESFICADCSAAIASAQL